MSVRRITYVTCDKCGKSISCEDCSKDVMRRIARNNGYHYSNDSKEDFCPDCYQSRKLRKEEKCEY